MWEDEFYVSLYYFKEEVFKGFCDVFSYIIFFCEVIVILIGIKIIDFSFVLKLGRGRVVNFFVVII